MYPIEIFVNDNTMCLAPDIPERSGGEKKKMHLMGTIARIFDAPLTSYEKKTTTIPYAFYRTFRIRALLETTTKHLKKESNVKCFL